MSPEKAFTTYTTNSTQKLAIPLDLKPDMEKVNELHNAGLKIVKKLVEETLGLNIFEITKTDFGTSQLIYIKNSEIVFAYNKTFRFENFSRTVESIDEYNTLWNVYFAHQGFKNNYELNNYDNQKKYVKIGNEETFKQLLLKIRKEWENQTLPTSLEEYFILFHCAHLSYNDLDPEQTNMILLNKNITNRKMHEHFKNTKLPYDVTDEDLQLYLNLPQEVIENLLK